MRGKDEVNLDPVTGRCVPCLVKRVQVQPMPAVELRFDPKKAAANDGD